MLRQITNRMLSACGVVTISQARDMVRAACDLTRTTHENKNHWKDSDSLSGRSTYAHAERKIARERSRMERASNSWYSGMIRTARAHVVGTGPRLQVLTSDPIRNRRIEAAWSKHSSDINLTDKLGTAVEADWTDGEAFLMRSENETRYPITTDVCLYECDQVSQPFFHQLDRSIEDGKRVDRRGNAVEYWIYDHHPGDFNLGYSSPLSGNWYPASDVIHLYRQDRPGQLRGFPRCAPAIEHLAHMRRFSKATLSAAERAALWGLFVSTTGSSVVAKQMPEDFMNVEWERNLLNFLPDGWKVEGVDSKHPGSSNAEFQRTELTYFCRCANMPYSLASGTSRDSNFSSAKMDIKNLWEPEVKSEQDRLNRLVMAPIFRWFLEDLAISTDILDGVGLLGNIAFRFYWPPVPQADETDVATASSLRMSTGQSTPASEAAMRGDDDEQHCLTAAANYGVSVDEYKRARFAKHFATGGTPGGVSDPAAAGQTQPSETAGAFAGTRRRDFTNNQKATAEVLSSMIDGASEVVAKNSLMRLGWSSLAAQELIDDARDGAIDATDLDPAQTTEAAV